MSDTLRKIEREVAQEVLGRLGDAVLDVIVLNPEMTPEEVKLAKGFGSAIIAHVAEQYGA